MLPEQRVKFTLQFILTATFLVLCILSLFSLVKEETSLAFSKDKSAYFPSITICPMTYDLKGLESFDNISTVSIRDFLSIRYGNYLDSQTIKIVDTQSSDVFSTVIQPLKLYEKLQLRNCTTLDTLNLNDDSIKPATPGFLFYIEVLPNPHFTDFYLIFHEQGDIEIEATTDDGNSYFVNYKNRSTNFVELTMKRYIDLNTKDNPCEEKKGNKSFLHELNQMYLDNMECTLPWLNGTSKL